MMIAEVPEGVTIAGGVTGGGVVVTLLLPQPEA